MPTIRPWLAAALLVVACLCAHPTSAEPLRDNPAASLPADFPLSPVTWGGFGGAVDRASCPTLTRHPVILVHDDGEGPEAWRQGPDGGLMGALGRQGFGPCELWAIKLGDQGRPMRSIEELTDDLAFFIGSVMAYTGAPRVQLVGRGTGAFLAHATLAKYRLHGQVHAAIWLDAPFQGLAECNDTRCVGGEVHCCTLQPGSLLLRRALLPLETPYVRMGIPNEEQRHHLRYLALGPIPATDLAARGPDRGGWMLDGAANLAVSRESLDAPSKDPELWALLLEALSDPATACSPDRDQDGDGFCARASGGADCDDDDPAVHPGAEEIEADGIDQNCNGHDVDRRFPGWACERGLTERTAEPGLSDPAVASSETEPARRVKPISVLLILLATAGLVLAGRAWRRRGSSGAGVGPLMALAIVLAPSEALSEPSESAQLPPLPPEFRFAVLLEPAQGDMNAALARCRRGMFELEPMPDRHPHREPEGPHYRDLGFLAVDELDEPYRATLLELERTRQACTLLDTPVGPVVLARLEGIEGSSFSTEDQDAWQARRAAIAGAGRLRDEVLPAMAAERGLPANERTTQRADDTALVPGGMGWVGTGHSRRPVQVADVTMDRTPVTADAYRHFAEAAGYRADPRSLTEGDGPQAAWTDMADAHAYCAWAGGRMPTLDEFDWATRDGAGEIAVKTNAREWTSSAIDAERTLLAGEHAATPWQHRAADLVFRCAYPASAGSVDPGSSAQVP